MRDELLEQHAELDWLFVCIDRIMVLNANSTERRSGLGYKEPTSKERRRDVSEPLSIAAMPAPWM